MKTFEEFVLDWWHDYLQDADDNTLRLLMEGWIGDEETIDDYIPEEAENEYDWLYANVDDAKKIWQHYFGCDGEGVYDDMPDNEEMCYQLLLQCACWYDGDTRSLPSFTEEYLRDMANHISDYEQPIDFFRDLQNGCQTGLIGMLIYNYDCKRIYIEHMDDLEEYVESIENELGEPIRNRNKLPHYTFVTWLCYEELGFSIGRILYPDEF